MKHYFLNFPAISYQGFAATNIMERAEFVKQFKDNYELFYDYTVKQNQTAEHLATDYYGAPEYVWVIYLFNDIIDPYYQWPLTDAQFNTLIINKYGSYPSAQQNILYFENNWYQDSSSIDVAGYQSLPANLKKYWTAQIKTGNIITKYVRKQSNTQISTNQIVSANIDIQTNAQFSTNEIVIQNSISQGQVAFANSSTIKLVSISGSFNNSSPIIGLKSGANAIITSAISISNTLPDDEMIYFSPVTALDYETQLNVMKSHVKLLRKEYLGPIEQSFKQIMQS